MNLLKELYEIHSPSKKEWAMSKYIIKHIQTIPDTEITKDKWGNLFIVKGQAAHYPCVVAHLDQVQKTHSRDFTAVETNDLIFGYSPSRRQQEGLGADDKNGIWIALKCLEKYDILKVALFTGEEIGCVGSSQADLTFFENVRFVVQPDRRGFRDCITSIYGMSLCSEEFINNANIKAFDYHPAEGAVTDILTLKERGLAVSCINLSCGYYEPHSDKEFTVKKDLQKCLSQVEYIIEHCTETYPHIVVRERNLYEWEWDEDYEMAMEDIFQLLEVDPFLSIEDLCYMYHTNYPKLSKEDFENIYKLFFDLTDDYYEEFGIQQRAI